MTTVKAIQIRNSLYILKHNGNELKRAEKDYKKAYKHLMKEKYTTNYVHNLERKYLEGHKPNEKKFNQEMIKLSQQFYSDLHIFVKWFNKVFTIFDQIAYQDDMSEYEDFKYIDEILKAAYGKKVYYGEETIRRFKGYMNHLINKIQIEAKIAVLDAKRVAHNKDARFSLFARIRGETALSRKIARIVRRKLPKAEHKSDKIKEILLEEIRSNNLKQDFLALFESLLKIDETNIINAKIIKKDIATLIHKHIRDANTIMDHIKNFSAIAIKYIRINSELKEDSEIFNETGKKAEEYVDKEFKNEGILYRFGTHTNSDANLLIKKLELAKKDVQKHDGIYFKKPN